MPDVTLTEVEAGSLLETLDAAHNCLWVEDLRDSYRKLNRQSRSSPLTLAVEASRNLLADKIGIEVPDESA